VNGREREGEGEGRSRLKKKELEMEEEGLKETLQDFSRRLSSCALRTAQTLNISALQRDAEEAAEEEAALSSLLSSQGYAIVDGLWGGNIASAFRDEISTLYTEGHMDRNSVAFLIGGGGGGGGEGGGGKSVQLDKPHVYEADLHDGMKRQHVRLLRSVFEAAGCLASAINAVVPQAELDEGKEREKEEAVEADGEQQQKIMTVKLQMNEGDGGCFPWHYDNPAKP
jgi:hypothetical protein